MFQKWRSILCFNELNESITYHTYGTKRQAKQLAKRLSKRNSYVDYYIM